MQDELKINLDFLSVFSIVITFISILLTFNLSIQNFILSISIFLIVISTLAYFSFRNIINKHANEIKKINEKINIYKDIAELKAGLNNMMKKGQTNLTDILIRIVQIIAIIIAAYLILKALGIKI